jgi:hypothetical protein
MLPLPRWEGLGGVASLTLSHKPIKHYGPTEASLLVEGRGDSDLVASKEATLQFFSLHSIIIKMPNLPIKRNESLSFKLFSCGGWE